MSLAIDEKSPLYSFLKLALSTNIFLFLIIFPNVNQQIYGHFTADMVWLLRSLFIILFHIHFSPRILITFDAVKYEILNIQSHSFVQKTAFFHRFNSIIMGIIFGSKIGKGNNFAI